MSEQKNQKKTNLNSQHRLFIDKARELEVNENEGAFDDKLKRLAKAKLEKKQTPDK